MSLVLPTQPADADGTLRKVPFANLIVYLRERDLTGSVVLDTERGAAAFSVRRGTPVKVHGFAEEAWLSTVCGDLGFVSEETLEETWSVAESTKRLHGQVLVQYGALDRGKLLRALAVQLERKMAQLASLPDETRFRFFKGTDVLARYGGLEEPEISSARLTWQVLRQAPPWAHIERSLAKCERAGLKLSAGVQLAAFGFDPDEEKVIEALRNGPVTFDELATRRLLAPSVLAALIYGLLVTKRLELSRAEGGEISSVSAVSGMFTPSTSMTAAVPVAPAQRPAALGVMSLGAPAAAEPALTAEQQAFRDEVAQRTREAGGQDYFAMLGVAEDASREAINGAYLQLAARWHPDKLPPALAFLREDVASIFALLTEAQQTLGNEEKRAQYLRLVKEGGATADDQAHIRAVVEASSSFQKAEVMLKRRDFSAAEEHATRALALDPTQGDHIALVAHLEAQRVDDRARLSELLADLDRAVSKSPRSSKALYYRAQLYKKLGKMHDAIEDFRRVAELDPDHVDAAREVRLAQMRSSKSDLGTASKPSGFFGKLFKK